MERVLISMEVKVETRVKEKNLPLGTESFFRRLVSRCTIGVKMDCSLKRKKCFVR